DLAFAFRAAADRSQTYGHPRCGRADQDAIPVCTWNPANDERSSKTDRYPRDARACILVQYNEPLRFPLDATTLGRTAAVMRNRCDVCNAGELDTQSIQSTHRRFTAWTGALDANFKIFNTVFHGSTAGCFSGNLRGKRRGFTRAFKARATRRSPGQCVALTVSNGDDRVVKRSVDVSNPVRHAFFDFLACA